MKYKLPDPIIFTINKDQNDFMIEMAKEIHACPVRSKGRAYDTVLKAVRQGVILEFALENQGAIKNPKPFDKTDPDSYEWDVDWYGLSEVKAVPDCRQFPEDMKSHWVTFPERQVKTYIKNITRNPGKVDKIIFGVYNEIKPNTFDVAWRLVAPSDTFKSNIRKCNPKWKSSYDKATGKLKYFYSHKTEYESVYNYNIYDTMELS